MIAVCLGSCHTSKQTMNDTSLAKEKTALTEKSWKLKKLYGKDVKKNEFQQKEAFIHLTSDGRITGFSGCNSISGNYILKGGLRIRFDKVATSLMMCDEAINEQGFLAVINTTDNYTLSKDGKELSLNKARMAPLAVFELVDANPKTGFNLEQEKKAVREKYWKLETLYGKKVTMTETQEREAFFRLTLDGRLVGFSGCNALSGSYTLEEGFRISFDKVAVTKKMCDEAINERDFLEVLNTADNYTLSAYDEKLSLNKARMAPLATFKAMFF